MTSAFHIWYRRLEGRCLLIWLTMRVLFFDDIHLLMSEIENVLLLLPWLRHDSFPDKLVFIVFGKLLNHFYLINIINIKFLRAAALAP